MQLFVLVAYVGTIGAVLASTKRSKRYIRSRLRLETLDLPARVINALRRDPEQEQRAAMHFMADLTAGG